jgi:hypothetical protein
LHLRQLQHIRAQRQLQVDIDTCKRRRIYTIERLDLRAAQLLRRFRLWINANRSRSDL